MRFCERDECDAGVEIVLRWIPSYEAKRHAEAASLGDSVSIGVSELHACREHARESWYVLRRAGLAKAHRVVG